MQGGAEKGNHLDRLEILVGKLQPQGKEEQGHADFSQELNIVNLMYGQPAGVLAKQDAGEDVAKDERLAQALHDEPADKGGDDQNDDVGSYAHRYTVLQEKKLICPVACRRSLLTGSVKQRNNCNPTEYFLLSFLKILRVLALDSSASADPA